MLYLNDGCSLEGREHEHEGYSHHDNVPHSHITNTRHLASFLVAFRTPQWGGAEGLLKCTKILKFYH